MGLVPGSEEAGLVCPWALEQAHSSKTNQEITSAHINTELLPLGPATSVVFTQPRAHSLWEEFQTSPLWPHRSPGPSQAHTLLCPILLQNFPWKGYMAIPILKPGPGSGWWWTWLLWASPSGFFGHLLWLCPLQIVPHISHVVGTLAWESGISLLFHSHVSALISYLINVHEIFVGWIN